MLLPLYHLEYKNKIVKMIIRIIIIAWAIFVSVGRVLIGAHYASDVLFASMFGIFIYSALKDRNEEYQVNHYNQN